MKISLTTFILLLSVLALEQSYGQNMEERKKKIEAHDQEGCSEEQNIRKAASIDYCKNHQIPAFDTLPCLESERQTTIRTKDEIIHRALALCYLGVKSEGLAQQQLDGFDKKFGIRQHFTPEELKYVNAESPTQQQKVNANWRYESLHVLLWALGYIEELKHPSEVCDVASDVGIIARRTPEQLITDAKLRSKKEILDQADLIYRLHWAVVDARIKNQKAPGELNPSIVYERHYVLNWLIRYMDQDWDDVTTDT